MASPGAPNGLSAAGVLEVLRKELPDDVLHACFPHHRPAEIRELLAEISRLVPPPPEPAGSGAFNAKGTGLRLTLYTDGAARGNPGEAGAGVSILDEAGREIYGGGEYLGRCTNNVAEYRALLHGLVEAARLGAGHLDIYLDSELLVKQIQGKYRVKNAGLKPLYDKAVELLAGLGSFRISHVPRAENRRADQLANAAIDNRSARD